MANIRKAIADIAVANGYEGGEPQTIISALDALTDTLAGDDEDEGASVEGAIRTLSTHIGSGGASFGEPQYTPMTTSTAPTVGSKAPDEPMNLNVLGADEETALFTAFMPPMFPVKAISIAEGVHVTSDTYSSVDSVDAYVITIALGPQGNYVCETVTPWDGQFDVIETQGGIAISFVMPDLGGSVDGSGWASTLVFHLYNK